MSRIRNLVVGAILALGLLSLAPAGAQAATIADYGTVTLPFSTTFSNLTTENPFNDAYLFTTPTASTISSFQSVLPLDPVFGIADFVVQLFETDSLGAPVGSALAGGGPTLSYSNLQGGQSYGLFVSGSPTGTDGGAYAGVMHISAVPLPAALPLLGSGLVALGLFLRRRRQQTA